MGRLEIFVLTLIVAVLALQAATVHWQIPWLDFLPEAIRRYYGP